MEYPVETQQDSQIGELEQIVRTLAAKHNDLVVSLSLVWSEMLRSSSDPILRKSCEKRLEETVKMFFEIYQGGNSMSPLPFSKMVDSNIPPGSVD